MKRTARIVFVLLAIALVGNLPLLADWPILPGDLCGVPEHDYLALRITTETGPVDLPPWLPTSEADYKVLNMSTAVEAGSGEVGNINAVNSSMDLGSSTAQAIPGSRAGSFMSEERLAERSLRGTIKRLG